MARQTFAALFVIGALLAVSVMGVAADPGAQVQEPPTNATESADQAYVTDAGDVMLVYEDDEAGDGTGHAGFNADEGLAYGNFQWSDLETNVTGSLSMAATRTEVNTSADLSTPRPDAIESISIEVDSVTNDTEASLDAFFDTTVALPDDSAMIATLFSDAETTGQVQTTGTTLSTTGTADWTATVPGVSAERFEYDLRRTEDGHRLSVEQERQIQALAVDDWNTRAKARERLRDQFQDLTSPVGGSVTFTLESYTFEETEAVGQLSVAYTVDIEGLNDVLRQSMAAGLSGPMATGPSSFGPSQSEVQSELQNISIERATVAADWDGQGGTATWNVTLEHYDDLIRANLAAMQASEDSEFFANQAERYEARIAAMNAADLVQTASWDLSVEATSAERIVANGSFQQRTDNWEAYVAEQEQRDLPQVGTQRLGLTVLAVEDRIDAEGSFMLRHPDLYNLTIQNYRQSLQANAASAAPIEDAFQKLEDAGFRGARLDADLDGSTATLEAGAAFENITAIASAADVPFENGTVERAYVSQDEDGSTANLRVRDAVPERNLDESTVRQLEPVSEETAVHMPTDWDEETKSFGSLDVESVRSFVPNAHESANASGLPTALLAGGAGAVVILAGIGAVARYRSG